MSKTIDIYFDDLAPHLQDHLLEEHGISSPTKTNWNIFPIGQIVICLDEDEEDDNL